MATRSQDVDPADPDGELSRIREVFENRDRKRAASGAFARASERLADERLDLTAQVLERAIDEDHPRLLDVGCGGGRDLAHWVEVGWAADHLAGIDVVPDRVAHARAACPGVDIRLGSGGPLPFADASFDAVTASTVLSSIQEDAARRALCREMARVVRPGGLVVIYDFVIRNPRNPDVRPMPLRQLVHDVGRRPQGTVRLSPLVYAVAIGESIRPRFARLAMRLAPPTHRLTWWVVPRPTER